MVCILQGSQRKLADLDQHLKCRGLENVTLFDLGHIVEVRCHYILTSEDDIESRHVFLCCTVGMVINANMVYV